MPGWSLTFAFTQDPRFHTDNGKQYALYQINVTANYSSCSQQFPDASGKILMTIFEVSKIIKTQILVTRKKAIIGG